ncbi:ATP-dependent RNA helicase dbp7 [Sorochytrium milnesiophthora]
MAHNADDDGIQLNFGPAARATAVAAAKVARPIKSAKPPAAPQPPKAIASQQAPQPTRTEKSPRPQPRQNATKSSSKVHDAHKKKTRKEPFQVISSLFTYNPGTAAEQNVNANGEGDDRDKTASNKPLEGASFSNLGLHPVLAHHLATRMKIVEPTLIQTKSLTASSASPQHRDTIIQSETGSGKTLAYLLPIVNKLLFPTAAFGSDARPTRELGPLVLILAPTRELAVQIQVVLDNLMNISRTELAESGLADSDKEPQHSLHWAVSSTLIGGEKKKSEKARIRKGINIIVSTPGRLLDHLRTTQALNVQSVKWLVLDEADRLLDMGFEEDLRAIFKFLDGTDATDQQQQQQDRRQRRKPATPASSLPRNWPATRQTVLCSATMKSRLSRLIDWGLQKPLLVSADPGMSLPPALRTTGSGDAASSSEDLQTPAQLTHTYLVVPLKLRLVSLVSYILPLITSPAKLLVFFSTRAAVDFYHQLLSNRYPELHFSKLHGSLTVVERREAISRFGGADTGVMLTTDVAARGLDLNVDAIVQYDAPVDVAEYVHRVGRTARCGKSGEAVLFIGPGEEDFIGIVRGRGVTLRAVTVEERGAALLAAHKYYRQLRQEDGSAAVCKTWEDAATEIQLAFEQWVLASEEALSVARAAFISYVKGYATYPSNLKHIFHVRKLHLGHLAKSFALRETPSIASAKTMSKGNNHDNNGTTAKDTRKSKKAMAYAGSDNDGDGDSQDEEQQPQQQQQPTIRKRGAQSMDVESYAKIDRAQMKRRMVDEFQIGAGAYSAYLAPSKKRQKK